MEQGWTQGVKGGANSNKKKLENVVWIRPRIELVHFKKGKD